MSQKEIITQIAFHRNQIKNLEELLNQNEPVNGFAHVEAYKRDESWIVRGKYRYGKKHITQTDSRESAVLLCDRINDLIIMAIEHQAAIDQAWQQPANDREPAE